MAALAGRSLKKERQGKWLLKGLLQCGECGGKMYGSLGSGRDVSTYACGPGNQHVAISAEKLEWYVEGQVFLHILDRATRAAEADGFQPTIERLTFPGQERLDVIEVKLSELWAAYRESVLPIEVATAQQNELRNEQRDLEKQKLLFDAKHAEQGSAFTDSHQIWNQVGDNFYSLSPEDKALLLRSQLHAVVIAKGKRGRDGWGKESLEERLGFEWKANPRAPEWQSLNENGRNLSP